VLSTGVAATVALEDAEGLGVTVLGVDEVFGEVLVIVLAEVLAGTLVPALLSVGFLSVLEEGCCIEAEVLTLGAWARQAEPTSTCEAITTTTKVACHNRLT
jgi:hypothetical protein